MKLMRQKITLNSQAGQVLLITLLIMVVGLTVGLAVIARSVTSVKISTEEEDSQRAFYAAEAGLEEALLANTAGFSTGSIGTARYNVIVAAPKPGVFNFNNKDIAKDDTQTVWLSEHTADGTAITPALPASGDDYDLARTIDVCWTSDSPTKPALELIIIYQQRTTRVYGLARGVYDPDSGRIPYNKFSSADEGSYCGIGYKYRKTVTFSELFSVAGRRVIALRLRPIYNAAKLAVRGNGDNLPSQEREIESTGTAGAAEAVKRRLKVNRSYPALPPIFDFVMFSGTRLEKKMPVP